MEQALTIAALVALIAFTLLSIFAMVSLSSANKLIKDTNNTINDLSRDIKEFKNKSLKTLDEINIVKDRVTDAIDQLFQLQKDSKKSFDFLDNLKNEAGDLVRNTNETLIAVKNAANTIDRQASNIESFVKPLTHLSGLVVNKIAPPITYTATAISAAGKAVSVFSEFLKRRKS